MNALTRCLMGISTAINFAEQRAMLRWAKERLPEDKYREIKRSYYAILKWATILMVVFCAPVILVFLLLALYTPVSTNAENAVTPAGTAESVLARVDYDGNFYWTHDSRKYEHALKDYGFSPENYEFGDKVKVYVDNVQNIIKVTAAEDGLSGRTKEALVWLSGAFSVPLLTMIAFTLIATRTFGKPWAEFGKEFGGR